MEKYNDLIGNTGIYHKEAINAWHNMHRRIINSSNYSSVSICTEWYTYSNFYNWFSTNYVPGWDMDKDIKGGKTYSPQYCIFVPREVNLLFRNVKTKYGKGVVKNGDGYQAQITINGKNEKLGTYSTISEATNVYTQYRKMYLYNLSVKYTNSGELSAILLNLSK